MKKLSLILIISLLPLTSFAVQQYIQALPLPSNNTSNNSNTSNNNQSQNNGNPQSNGQSQTNTQSNTIYVTPKSNQQTESTTQYDIYGNNATSNTYMQALQPQQNQQTENSNAQSSSSQRTPNNSREYSQPQTHVNTQPQRQANTQNNAPSANYNSANRMNSSQPYTQQMPRNATTTNNQSIQQPIQQNQNTSRSFTYSSPNSAYTKQNNAYDNSPYNKPYTSYTQPQPQNQSQVQQQLSNAASTFNGTNLIRANSSNNSATNDQYTIQEKSAWYKSCLAPAGKQDEQAAMAFCSCGWEHISSGQLPPALLTSTNSNDTKKRADILKVIQQQCLVQLMAAKGK